jgi:hypothetical protein
MISVEAALTAEDTFTDVFVPPSNPHLVNMGQFTISISGTWEGTISLMRSIDGGDTWLEVDSWTANVETSSSDLTIGVQYKLGFQSGNFTSGTANVGLYK